MIIDNLGRLLAHEMAEVPSWEPVILEEYPMAVPLSDYGIVIYLRAAVGNSPDRMRAMVEGLFTQGSGKLMP
jgi:hypothetical protein